MSAFSGDSFVCIAAALHTCSSLEVMHIVQGHDAIYLDRSRMALLSFFLIEGVVYDMGEIQYQIWFSTSSMAVKPTADAGSESDSEGCYQIK